MWMRPPAVLCLVTAVVAIATGCAVAQNDAQATVQASPTEGMDGRTHDLWQRHWRRFATRTIAFEGDFVAMPLWEPRFPSSRHLSIEMYRRSKTQTNRVTVSPGMVRTIETSPPTEDCRYGALTLPEMRPGHYGHIHSFAISEVLGPEDMLIEEVWLIDDAALREAKRTFEDEQKRRGDSRAATETTARQFEARDAAAAVQRDRGFRSELRLVGFSTQGLKPKDRWPNRGEELPIAIAVVAEELPPGRRTFSSRRPRVVAVPADWFHRNLSEAQFADLLKKRSLSPAQFVELVTSTMRQERDPAVADLKVFEELERRRQAAEEAAQTPRRR